MEVTATQKVLSPRIREDYKLVCAAIEGNQKAYATLMKRYRSSVFHTIYKMVNNRDEAEDLTLEAFGKAFTKLSTYAPDYAFSTWLFRIAINNTIDHLRKKNRLSFLSIDDTIEPDSDNQFCHNIRDSALDPEENLIRDQRINWMKKQVKNLSEKYRRMIELRFYKELSYDEIAQELDIPLGTVKAQLFRAKELLYGMMQQPHARAHLDSTVRR